MPTLEGLDLGTFGVWTFDFEHQPAARLREWIQELEDQGWGAVWIPELLGREALSHAGYLLSCTNRIQVINAIAQISERTARAAHGGSLLLADAYPNRHVMGLGYGARRPEASPLVAMNAYLDEMDAAETPNPPPATPLRRVVAAYGPKMLAVARDRSAGAHTYKVNTAHTAQAREILGPDAFLGVEHAVLFETDPDKARAIARDHLALYLAAEFNVTKFRRLGYAEKELADGGSDRFVDDFVFWGDLENIAKKLHGHIDAGADHVGIQVIGIDPGDTAMPYWRLLSQALLPHHVDANPDPGSRPTAADRRS
jgi:probable F420-dependent oxidoreductase